MSQGSRMQGQCRANSVRPPYNKNLHLSQILKGKQNLPSGKGWGMAFSEVERGHARVCSCESAGPILGNGRPSPWLTSGAFHLYPIPEGQIPSATTAELCARCLGVTLQGNMFTENTEGQRTGKLSHGLHASPLYALCGAGDLGHCCIPHPEVPSPLTASIYTIDSPPPNYLQKGRFENQITF